MSDTGEPLSEALDSDYLKNNLNIVNSPSLIDQAINALLGSSSIDNQIRTLTNPTGTAPSEGVSIELSPIVTETAANELDNSTLSIETTTDSTSETSSTP